MGEATGTLNVVTPGAKESISWNGVPADREAARARFEEVMATKTYFAFAEAPTMKKAQQVRTFDEIEQIEKREGAVTATVQPSLVGG